MAESICWDNLSNAVKVRGDEGQSRKKEETSISGRKRVIEGEVSREVQEEGKVGGTRKRTDGKQVEQEGGKEEELKREEQLETSET